MMMTQTCIDSASPTNNNRDSGRDGRLAYFLQEYLGFTPSFSQAAFKGEPSLKYIFLPFAVRIVICREIDLRRTLLEETNACADPTMMAHRRATIKEIFDISGN